MPSIPFPPLPSRCAALIVAVPVLLCPHLAMSQIATASPTQYQPLTLDLSGPAASEVDGRASPTGDTTSANPFLDYRLDVTFSHTDGTTYKVPGYYAVDNAAGADIWRTRFTPDRPGQWTYSVDFRTGTDVAISSTPGSFATTGPHGTTSNFSVAPVDPNAPGFLSKGRLSYAGKHYLRFANGEYFIKGGTDSPENWLGYAGFDGTRRHSGSLHTFSPHNAHYNPVTDPSWDGNSDGVAGDNDATGIIGALNYLASKNVNSIYFLPMNIGGDGKDSYPFLDRNQAGTGSLTLTGSTSNDNLHYDLSKLEQWEQFFAHAQKKGINLNVVLNEAEDLNKRELDDATLGTERKLFYREIVARFAHHNAMNFNISEEYNRGLDLGEAKVNEFAEYLRSVDPYKHPITVHNGNFSGFNGPSSIGQRNELEPFLDESWFELTSFQSYTASRSGADMEYFRARSQNLGRPIPISIDEPQTIHSLTADQVRKEMTWDIYLSGGQVEWFVQDTDQSLEDFATYQTVWEQTWHARKFVQENLPFWDMDSIILTPNATPSTDDDWMSADTLIRGEDTDFGGAEVFFKDGVVYAIYFPDGSNDDNANTVGSVVAGVNGPPELNLTGHDGLEFTGRWYDPRLGLFVGSPFTLLGGDWVSVGVTPDGFRNTNDWTLLVTVVPEPASLSLVALVGGIMLRRSREGA